jgi:hypothetical protein
MKYDAKVFHSTVTITKIHIVAFDSLMNVVR